jgi:hypothetical protein
MTKYQVVEAKDKWEVHPVWRGIGLLLIIIMPILSYAVSDLLLDANIDKIRLPSELTRPVDTVVFGVVNYLWARVVLTGLFTVIGFTILSIIYSIIYRFAGPDRYGPLDVPPERRRPRRRR